MKKKCVVIPAYNEAKAIGPLVKDLKGHGYTAYVVDDGSVDDTAAIAELEGATVIKNNKNLGKGASLIKGFERALQDGYDVVITMDGDGQHEVTDIEDLLEKMESSSADMVVGNRMLDTSSMPWLRVRTNLFMSGLISGIAGQAVCDTQCGFRLIKKEVLDKIKLASSRYEIESEMIIKAGKAGFKIESAPIKTVYSGEKSRINPFLDTLRFIKLLIKIEMGRWGN